MRHFKGDSVPNLDTNLIILAEDSKAKATTLFNDNIDLTCYTSEDYKRLRSFLIPWYSSLRSFPSTMAHASDARSLPKDHLNELINSFGFVDGLDELTNLNKIDFFYDLVNLYKIKGTPESIFRVLGYFGIPNVELVEYWLQYDNHGDLVFKPNTILTTSLNSLFNDNENLIDFSVITNNDPHWMLTESQINQLFINNKLNFPSKSPYFGIRPIIELLGNTITPILAILTRLVLDQYDSYIHGTIPAKNIKLSTLNIYSSILDLHLATIYSFNLLYSKTNDSADLSTIMYSGSLTNMSDIITYYDTLTKRSNNQTRDEIYTNKVLLDLNFTKLRSDNFLNSFDTAKNVLTTSNLDLKTIIETYYLEGNGEECLKILLKNLNGWIQNNISDTFFNISSLILGLSSLSYVSEVVNFFKPHRARLIFIENIYTIINPALDCIIADDRCDSTITETIVDFDVADSKPGYEEDWNSLGNTVYSTPPTDLCRRITDIYVDSNGIVKCHYEDSTSWTEITSIVYSEPEVGEYRVTNIYLSIGPGGSKNLHVDYESNPETIGGIKTKILSLAPSTYYTITNIYFNSSFLFEIVYDSNPVIWPIDSTARIYFSRITYDCDSFFDIGASCDSMNDDININVDHYIPDIYDAHIGDATCTTLYYLDAGLEVIEAISDGGWNGFDSGMLFDNPQVADACHIYVQSVGP